MTGMLSQEEINALLAGGTEALTDGIEDLISSGSDTQGILSEDEKDAIGEICNISMGTAATTLYSLVGQRVDITTPTVSCGTWDDLISGFESLPCVTLQIGYKEGLDGNNLLILREKDVKIITDLMMGGDGTNIDGELSELHLSAIGEAMNQMMGSSSTSLSSMINKKIDILPPIAQVIELNDQLQFEENAPFLNGEFVKVSFKMTIGDLVDSAMMQLFPITFAKELFSMFMAAASGDSSGSADEDLSVGMNTMVAESTPVAPQPAPQMTMPEQPMMQQQPPMGDMSQQYGMPPYGMPYGMPQNGAPYAPYPQQPMTYGVPQQPVNVQAAQFQSFSPDIVAANQKENIGLIMDVPLEVTVELGRTSKSIKDILEFTPGTIIELNKIAGETVDVLVNGKYVAKGEVVVIEESFAIRVTDIIK